MKQKRIVIAGGTGFIGEELIRWFGKENDIVVLSRGLGYTKTNRNEWHILKQDDLQRTRYVQWDGCHEGDWEKEIEGADLLINLAGKTVNCRYTEKNKKEIFDSRTQSTTALGKAIVKAKHKPALWINASSATIYRHATDRPQDEYTGEMENDFSVQVCRRWEQSFYEQDIPGVRKVALRMAITLGAGGVLIPYFNLLKYGLGGKQGSGRQMYSWVHVEDTCRLIEWIWDHPEMEGTYNCCSPNPVTNESFMQLLRKATRRRFGLPAFTWMLKAGAVLIGTETELVLKSRWVLPARALESGFVFRYPLLTDAFHEIISRVPRKQYHLF